MPSPSSPASSHASSSKSVIVVGGGVAGLTAAQELAERGYQVTVYERKDILGGKARSVQVPDTAPANGEALPGEHGFRFLPAFYRHLPDTMARIPRSDGSVVADSLVSVHEILFATYENPPFSLPLGFAIAPDDLTGTLSTLGKQAWKLVLFLPGLVTLKERGSTLTVGDLAFYAGKLWEILTSCQERRLETFEGNPWWKFLDADARSHAFQKYLAIGLTRNLVACKADKANTLTIGQVAIQMMLSIFRPWTVDRVLDGPTNEVWIDPWRDYLSNPAKFPHPPDFRHPVRFVTATELAGIDVNPQTEMISSIRVRPAPRKSHAVLEAVRAAVDRAEKDPEIQAVADIWHRNSLIIKQARDARLAAEARETAKHEPPPPEDLLTADHYVFALPVEQIADFVTPAMEAIDPALKGLQTLRTQVDWMTGIQFYLTRHIDLPVGHVDYLDTEWALTSISQDERLWPKGLDHYGDGTVKQILSVDISDWAAKDPKGREAWDLPPLDVAKEVWRQLQKSLNRHGDEKLSDHMLHPKYRWFLDDDIDERVDPHKRQTALVEGKPDLLANAEPLLVNLAGSRTLRPDAVTKVKNMYLASDYVLTHTELATMEAANEAARRAVNGILGLPATAAGACQVTAFSEPLQFLRALDERRMKEAKPWSMGAFTPVITLCTHIAVLGCHTLVFLRERVLKKKVTLANLPTSSPLRAPGPGGVPAAAGMPASGNLPPHGDPRSGNGV